MTNFKTGDVGENWVQLWASQAGITANPTRRDEFGWDFCLQVRRDEAAPAAIPLDRLPPELTCMVQVKTTLVGAKSEHVTLSNWQRMVKDPLPWFFARVVLNEEGEPENVYLVHVDENWMEQVLRRLRASSSEEKSKLNRQTLALTWTDAEAIPPPFARSLRERLQAAVSDPTAYVEQKARNFRDLGYSRARYKIRLGTPLKRTPDDIALAVDFAIGLIPRLPISALTVSDVRFGISHLLEDSPDLEGGSMEFTSVPSIGTTKLSFSNRKRTSSVMLECETYVPTLLFPKLPEQYFKARFVAPMVSIVTNPKASGMKIGWQLPEDEAPVLLSDLTTAGVLATLFAKATVGNPVTVAYEKSGKLTELAFCNSPPGFLLRCGNSRRLRSTPPFLPSTSTFLPTRPSSRTSFTTSCRN
jgi:hypothetical protein